MQKEKVTVYRNVTVFLSFFVRGTRWRSSLRHCAQSRKIAVSIPESVIGIFDWHNTSGRISSLGSSQPLREMSTRNISWV